MTETETKKDIVNYFLNKKILLSPELFKKINSMENLEEFYQRLLNSSDPLDLLSDNKKEKTEQKPINTTHTALKIVYTYEEKPKKRKIQDFVKYFNVRYKALEKILRQRKDLENVISINRLLQKKDKETVALIGMVRSKKTTRSGGIMLELEDPSGCIKVFINKNNKEMFKLAGDIVNDEVLGISGSNGDKIVFANKVHFPDIPLHKELKKAPKEAYAIFLSDMHLASDHFLPEKFQKFIDWLQGKVGSDSQKIIASKVKYLFIIGDLIDGIGIYPGQEDELTINDLTKQYEAVADYLIQIPSHIQIIICPGNHDGVRLAEPQPVLYKDLAKSLWDISNVTMVTNPAYINIHASEGFPGFDVLMYHGYSFDYYVANVDSIRNNGGYDRGDLIMKFLLQKRHLAPSHTSTVYIPETTHDPLVIKDVPDFFVTGHIHKSTAANYRNITLISGSCWQSTTPFQEKVGHHPEPARVPVVNLQTREVKIMRF